MTAHSGRGGQTPLDARELLKRRGRSHPIEVKGLRLGPPSKREAKKKRSREGGASREEPTAKKQEVPASTQNHSRVESVPKTTQPSLKSPVAPAVPNGVADWQLELMAGAATLRQHAAQLHLQGDAAERQATQLHAQGDMAERQASEMEKVARGRGTEVERAGIQSHKGKKTDEPRLGEEEGK